MAIDDLYERDFYVWTQELAAALRAAGKAGGKSNAVAPRDETLRWTMNEVLGEAP